jgi:hypothetical protein
VWPASWSAGAKVVSTTGAPCRRPTAAASFRVGRGARAAGTADASLRREFRGGSSGPYRGTDGRGEGGRQVAIHVDGVAVVGTNLLAVRREGEPVFPPNSTIRLIRNQFSDRFCARALSIRGPRWPGPLDPAPGQDDLDYAGGHSRVICLFAWENRSSLIPGRSCFRSTYGSGCQPGDRESGCEKGSASEIRIEALGRRETAECVPTGRHAE